MRKILLLCLFIFGLMPTAFAQFAKKGSAEKTSSKAKVRTKQMKHFPKPKWDKKMRHNGTTYKRNSNSKYNVNGDGFAMARQPKQRRKLFRKKKK